MALPEIRHRSRAIALQLLFQRYFKTFSLSADTTPRETYSSEDLGSILEYEKIDKDFVEMLYLGVVANEEGTDSIITRLAPEWPVSQISKLDLQILRMAIVEGFLMKLTAPKIAVNEAIELAKEFSNDQSRKFVSGVLGNLIVNVEKYIK
jgi:N utilization substance protein B